MSRWILLEDEPDLYDFLLQFTELLGVAGIGFPNAEQAIAWIEDVDNGFFDGELPALALLDYRMNFGSATGGDVVRRLRQSPILSNIAIVVMSAYAETDPDVRALRSPDLADRLIPKPLPHIYELRDLLFDTIQHRDSVD